MDRGTESRRCPHPLARIPALAAKDVTRAYDRTAERGFAVWKRTQPLRAGPHLHRRGQADPRAESTRSPPTSPPRTARPAPRPAARPSRQPTSSTTTPAWPARPCGTLLHDARPNTRVHTQREPIGVILVISPGTTR
ncbi:hypothetical protein ACRAWF_21225 [Streptomyces sp. L7]